MKKIPTEIEDFLKWIRKREYKVKFIAVNKGNDQYDVFDFEGNCLSEADLYEVHVEQNMVVYDPHICMLFQDDALQRYRM